MFKPRSPILGLVSAEPPAVTDKLGLKDLTDRVDLSGAMR